jgi:hypothetical protein
VATGLLELVQPPTALPGPYGLLETIGPTPGAGHWQQGVIYRSVCPVGGSTYDECLVPGTPPAQPTKVDNVDPVWRGASPFTVYAGFSCSPVGTPDLEQLADAALLRTEGWQVERAFWTGQAGGQDVVHPHLAEDSAVALANFWPGGNQLLLSTAATVVSGGNPAVAVGNLEQALADCYRAQGVIHAPVSALATLAANRLVERQGSRLVTAAGNTVVVGAGYPGTSPAGAAPAAGTTWLYATGRPFIYRGAPRASTVPDSLNRAENTVLMLAERSYLLGWDCCHLAAPLTLGST